MLDKAGMRKFRVTPSFLDGVTTLIVRNGPQQAVPWLHRGTSEANYNYTFWVGDQEILGQVSGQSPSDLLV